MTDIIRIPKDDLHNVCRAAFERVGVPRDDADAAADILVVGDLMGISTHGTRRVIIYCQRILDGAIVADPEITTGGCRVETQFGMIDQQFEAKLERIEEELTQ